MSGARVNSHLNDEVLEKLGKATIPLVEAGRLFFDLGPAGAYAAAKRGEIPSLKVGRKLVCPTAPLRRLLGIEEPNSKASVPRLGATGPASAA